MTTSRPHPDSHSSYVLKSHRSPHPYFSPTHLSFSDPHTGAKSGSWSSRRSRKGRYSPKQARVHYVTHKSAAAGETESGVGRSEEGSEKAKDGEVRRMEDDAVARIKRAEKVRLRPQLKMDVTFWIAVSFTLGSVVWVVNGFLVWFPVLRPELDTDAFSESASALAFIGGTIFLVGSYLMVVEALDRGREINFGTALGQLLHHRRFTSPQATVGSSDLSKLLSHTSTSSANLGDSHTQNVGNSDRGRSKLDEEGAKVMEGAKGFVWWGKPMWHDMGYLAAIVQLFAATIFWVSTLTGLPGVIPGYADGKGSTAIIDVFFWTPQVIGGTGFIVSSLILMLETQTHPWLPNLTDIGWWIGFWNLIGAFGFMLCGALGYSDKSGVVYESDLATFWGSWAFLIGSVVQLGEAIWREPEEGNGKS
ncbi:hypothetical protein B9479_007826 [Cryptococcus floricola]|uniref:Integral membrane protein n=1 Tax=Cryptococcus floricola TaxID=2591691 RepID=A0A5D3ANJ5_9TREE|nr:hypothetical protein B9479_007826 [Cryptococcus floricola]